jgi:hypothetical protein
MPGVFFGILADMMQLSEDDLCRSPRWFPLRLGSRNEVLCIELDEDAYRAASFLDERLLARSPVQATCTLNLLHSAAARLEPRAHFIFHIGHVGSTLISRLIGTRECLFSVREPALLRAFADPAAVAAGALTVNDLLALLARTWRAGQRAVIKATSIVNEAADAILGGADRPAAAFIYAAPLNYLRGIFAGPNSRAESRVLAPARMRRLERRIGVATPLDHLSEGEQVAMNWLSEMTTLHQASARFETRVLWVDFDEFLRDPVTWLHLILRAFGAESSASEVESMVATPIMRQYSKAPEHAYDAALRREVLASADWQHATEIKRGLDWLGRMASVNPLARDVLAAVVRRAANGEL